MPSQRSPAPPASRASLLPLVLAVLVGLLFLNVLAGRRGGWADRGEMHPSVGTRLADLQLAPLLNAPSALGLEDLEGQVVLINFWGPWCVPCRIEMPHLVELQRDFAYRHDFRLVSVSCGQNPRSDNSEQLRAETAAFAQDYEITFAVYRDPSLQSRLALMDLAELKDFGYPTTVLLDDDQRIRGLWVGYAPGLENEIRAVLQSVLE